MFKDLCIRKIIYKIQHPIYEFFFVWFTIKVLNIIEITNIFVDRLATRTISDTITSMVFMILFGFQTQIIERVTNLIEPIFYTCW